jgi:hypothetical protein
MSHKEKENYTATLEYARRIHPAGKLAQARNDRSPSKQSPPRHHSKAPRYRPPNLYSPSSTQSGDEGRGGGKNPNNVYITPVITQPDKQEDFSPFTTGQAGIDTVRAYVSIAPDSVGLESCFWDRQTRRRKRKGVKTDVDVWIANPRVGYSSVHLELTLDNESLLLDFNAARVIHSDPTFLLDPEDLPAAFRRVFDTIEDEVQPKSDWADPDTGEMQAVEDWKEKIKITRLDAASNFQIDTADALPLERALAVARPKNQKKKFTYDTDATWGVEARTASVGTDRFYNKTLELASKGLSDGQEPGIFLYRFEAELKKSRLKGVKLLSQINRDAVWERLEDRFHKTNWNVVIPKPNSLFEALRGQPVRTQERIAGFLEVNRAIGTSLYSSDLLRERLKELKSLGINLGTNPEDIGKPYKRLSLKHRRFVIIDPYEFAPF